MYEEKKFGWRAYKFRLLFIGFVWILAIAFRDSMGPPDISSAVLLALFFSLVVWGLGAWENELRYQTPSHIVAENGLHGSFHPFAAHHKGKWTMVAMGGISAGGIEFKGGEGTLVFPSALLQKPGTNPPKILHLRGAPCKCSIDALPQEVRDYIVNAGFGELKAPYYFTQTPIVDPGEDEKFKDAIIALSKTEGEIKDLNAQISEQGRIIRNFMDLHAEIQDALKPKWYRRVFGGKKEPSEED